MSKKPEFDYWMFAILEKALRSYELEVNFNSMGHRIYKENTNPFNPLGQIRVIQKRLRAIQEYIGNEIKKGLGIPLE